MNTNQTAVHNLTEQQLKRKATNAYGNMLNRVKTAPAYANVMICDEWLQYPKLFKEWYKAHYVEGWELDKDFVGTGLLYSPETCCFLPPSINRRIVNKNTPKALIETHKGESVTSYTVRGKHTGLNIKYNDYKQALTMAKAMYSMEWLQVILANAQEIKKCKWLTSEMTILYKQHLQVVKDAKIEDF